MTTGDTGLLEDLRDMWRRADPPPPGLTETMIAAVAAADLDEEWELLVLVRDSADEPAAQVRGLSTARVLYFNAAAGWSLEAEIDGDQVRGQLLDLDDLTGIEVTLETATGETWTTGLDEVGFFALQAEPTGPARFVVRHGDTVASSLWVEI
jgi:hypothetical protein